MIKELPHVVIKPDSGWKLIDWKVLYRYKDLLYFMVLRDITVIYKQTILGFAWAILNPVFSMIVFSVIFGNLAGVPSDGIPYPIFSFAALLPWTYFSASLTGATNSLVGSSNIFTKVYFPRIIIPLTPVLSKLADFAIAFVILIFMMVFYQISPDINIVFLPLLLVLMILTSAGMGMWLSALAIQYRDVKFAITLMVQLLMYLAPVVFPASLVKEKLGETAYLLYGIYPMTGVIEGFRAAIIGANPMPWDLIATGSIVAILLFVSGAFYFRKMERVFADVA